MKRTPFKNKGTEFKKSNYILAKGKGLKAKALTPEGKTIKQDQRDKDLAFYQKIWDSRPHICGQCQTYLGDTPLTLYFDHLLEKSKYKHLRYEEENIFLVCWPCHDKKTNGHPGDLHKAAIEKTKEIFGII